MYGSPNPDHNCRIQSNHPLISQTGKTDKIGGKKSVRPALNNPSSSYTPPASATNLSQANSVSKSIRLCSRRSCQVRLSLCVRTCSIATHSSSAHLRVYQLTEINLLLKAR